MMKKHNFADFDNELVQSMNQVAYAYQSLGNREEEQKILRALISIPDLPSLVKATFLERLALSVGTSDTKEAIEIYEEALKIFEGEHFKRFWDERKRQLAHLYESNGDYESAQRTLER